MKEKLIELLRKYWIGFIGSLALCALVLFFSETIHQYIGTKQNKIEFQKIEPVDYSKERSIEDCFDKRIPIEIKQFCTTNFPEG